MLSPGCFSAWRGRCDPREEPARPSGAGGLEWPRWWERLDPGIATGNPKNAYRARRGEEMPGVGGTQSQIDRAVDKVGGRRHLSSILASGATLGTSDSTSGPFPAPLPYPTPPENHFIFPVSPTKSISGADTPRRGPRWAEGQAVTFPTPITVGSGLGRRPGRVILQEAGNAGAEESGTRGAGRGLGTEGHQYVRVLWVFFLLPRVDLQRAGSFGHHSISCVLPAAGGLLRVTPLAVTNFEVGVLGVSPIQAPMGCCSLSHAA